MALKPCKECGNQISKKAKTCPQCGAKNKQGVGCLGFIGIGFVGFILLSVIVGVMSDGTSTTSSNSSRSVSSQSNKQKPKVQVYSEGKTISIGYTSYLVSRSYWSNRLSSNEFLDQKANANWLFVQLSVRNDDKKARSVPPFKLIDENGAEYESSSHGWAVEGSIGVLDSLNPNVQKQGFVVFDVPKERKYKLKVSGGYWSGEDAFIRLSPR